MLDTTVTQKCCTCKKTKDFSAFHKANSRKNGLQGQCKECYREYGKTEIGIEAAHKAASRYRKSDAGKACIATYKKTAKCITQRKIYRRTEKARQSALRYPEKRMARKAVFLFVRDGRMPPAKKCQCFTCTNQAHGYHHYKGYSKKCWLEVIPLCTKCHTLLHKIIA